MESNYGAFANIKNLIEKLNNYFKTIEERFLKYEIEQHENINKLIDLKVLGLDGLALEKIETTGGYIFEAIKGYNENKRRYLFYKESINKLNEDFNLLYNDIKFDNRLINTLDEFQTGLGKMSNIIYTLPKSYTSEAPLIQHVFLLSFHNSVEMECLFEEINNEVIKDVDIIKEDCNPQERIQILSLIKANQSSVFFPQNPPKTIEERAKEYRKVLGVMHRKPNSEENIDDYAKYVPQIIKGSSPVIEEFREDTQGTLLSSHMAALNSVESHSLDNKLSADFTVSGCQVFIPHQYRI